MYRNAPIAHKRIDTVYFVLPLCRADRTRVGFGDFSCYFSKNMEVFSAVKRIVFLCITAALCLFLLPACTKTKEPVTLPCRVVAVLGDELLLASEGREPIMTLTPAKNTKITLLRDGEPADADDAPTAGDFLYLTFDGGMLDTTPSVPRGVTQMDIVSSDFDNLAAVYLSVLTDLAKEEAQYFDGLSMLAVSLEETALPAWEQSAIAYAIARQYPALTVIEESRADLMAKGFMSKDPDSIRWHWDGGAFLTVSENTRKCSEQKRVFNANFQSGFAHGWTNCQTVRDADSTVWSPYDIGGKVLA